MVLPETALIQEAPQGRQFEVQLAAVPEFVTALELGEETFVTGIIPREQFIRGHRQMSRARFGCIECLPDGADEAWKAFGKSEIDARLIDDSHFIVLVRSCLSCGQRFVSVFTETIDWGHGEDPCFRTVLPITEPEALTLKTADSQAVESLLYGLDSNRQSLCRDWPKGAEAKNFWSRGIKPHPHD